MLALKHPQPQIQFLQQKIQELRSALFFSMTSSVLKMPTRIVTALKVDEWGQIWFFVQRPPQLIEAFDREFSAQLDFFKKGKDFFIKIIGRARIVYDPEEVTCLVDLPEEIKRKAMDQLVLIKVMILRADYYEHMISRTNWMRNLGDRLRKWMFKIKPGHISYRLGHDPVMTY